jgi:DNA recombination protein RmuC
MEIIVGIVLGVGIGAVVAWLVAGRRRGPEVEELVRRAAADGVRTASAEQTQSLLQQNQALLEGDRALVGEGLGALSSRLDQVQTFMHSLEADRERKFGELTEQLSLQHEGVTSLMQTTQSLREALSSTKARGQWGERMAEDVLRLAGFVENVNYRKQKALEHARGVPDFTFLLPNELLLHMDAKFPLDNYLRYCDAGSEIERKRCKEAFLRDVKGRVKELGSRSYVDPSGGTVDFVLLFIPNEQLYAFIHEHDGEILDEALRQRVVFCSPLTLFAVLALIRQMVENFQLARTSDEILALLGDFLDQWDRFTRQMEKVGGRIESAGKEYEALVTTRRRMLEKPLYKIDALRGRVDPALTAVDDEDGDSPLALEA